MDTLYTEYPVLSTLVLMYAVLAFIKVIVCLASVPAASAAFCRKLPGLSMPLSVVTMVLAIVIVVPCIMLQSLRTERLSFFFAYSNKSVIRQVFNGF